MSGGSFNYLCYVDDFNELVARKETLEEMQIALSVTGYSDKEAEETQEIIDAITELEKKVMAKADSLREVWKAMEWWVSGDSSEDGVRKAVDER